ncbi:hypothetical protein FPV67DRAFT_1091656 [Lyophyllum atratum]|nr:hypothetical protein FPV67DRAFT_1091656 [Lyophyllum atratum]
MYLVNVTVPHTDSRLKYLGTWDFSPGEKCAWRNTRTSGSSALLNFRGTSIKILGDTQLSLSSTVFLDGKQFGVVDGQGCDAVIFEGPGLDDEEHTIELVSANSPLGTLHLSGFVYTERGASAKQVRLPDHPLSTGAIAGIVVAVGGFIGLVGSIFLCWDYIIYFRLVSLLLGWLGWSVETKRRIFFKALKSLGTTEISLFLTTKEELEDFKEGDRERPLVWQVLHIGNTSE